MKSIHFLFIAIIGFVLLSCRDTTTYEGKTPMITTSIDTLTFDTVFTSVGSVTKSFKVYNKENKDILVTIGLENTTSPFRLNINGTATNSLDDVLIRAKDSIYVFADVTIDPNQPLSVSPFIVEQKLTINSADTQEEVLLSAFGQNANYLTPKNKDTGSILTCDFNSIIFNDPKPYVVYGLLIIDECNIVLPKGTELYVHGGVVTRVDDQGSRSVYQSGRIILLENGSLQTEGTLEEPVIIKGDRLDEEYENRPGQWYGIQLLDGSKNNSLKNTIIKNSTYGLQIDSAGVVKISDSQILNTAARAIEARHASVKLDNSLIANSGVESITLGYGGEYSLSQNTIVNFGNTSSAFIATNYQCNPNDCNNTLEYNALDLSMINNIIVGDAEDEFYIDDASRMGDELFLNLKNNIVKVDKFLEVEGMENFLTTQCENCINYNHPNDRLFVDYREDDYHLDTLSIAKDKGIISSYPLDLDGVNRDNIYDLGCYESTYK